MTRQTGIRILILASVTIGISCVDLYDFGLGNGDNQLPDVDDIATEVVFTQSFPFLDKLYMKTYVNANGLISMLVPVSSASEKRPLPIENSERVLIAPFWANVDVTEGGAVFYREIVGTDDAIERATTEIRTCFVTEFDFTANHALIVTWDRVSFFGHETSNNINPTNTFQLLLVSDGQESFAFFLYESIEWNAGTESGGDPEHGTGRQGATIGFNSGDPYNYFVHTRSSKDSDSQTQIDQFENCPKLGNGVYIYKIDGDEVVESGCQNDADLEIFPSVGSMFGGEEVFLVGPCWDSAANIMCRFLYNNDEVQTVTGTVLTKEGAVCVPQPFFLSGELKLEVSDDGGETFTFSQIYKVANIDRITSSGVTRLNPTYENWDLAGYSLEVRWDPTRFEDESNITISVLAYQEDDSQGPRWEEVYKIAEITENDGSYDFEGVPVSGVSEDNAFGAIRIHAVDKPDALMLWSDVHTLGYLLNQEYQDAPKTWSRIMCDRWAQEDENLPNFVDELIPCPCTLQQAIVDTGRFQPDTGCSMYAGSTCKYHQGAKHCVRSVAASETTNSGTQCCYKDNGDLMYAGDTDQGSTADRSHVWGAEPYQQADTVPDLSHWKHDVITFYYCCIWGDDCKTYLTLRPTADCKNYNPPKSSTTFGDPHLVTFDNLQYTFNGKGEFTLVDVQSYVYELQARMEQARCSSCGGNETDEEPQLATVLTAVAMTEDNTDTIHVELNPITRLKFVRKYTGVTEVVSFDGQEWLDFNGVSIIVVESDGNAIDKATITFWNSGIGVNVTTNEQMLSVAVTLPPSLKDNIDGVRGLLGNWDNSPTNDLIDRDGRILDPESATPEEIRDFGINWETTIPTLFYYESGDHTDYQDNDFIPLYQAPDPSTLPVDLVQDMERICGDNEQCRFDMSITRNTDVGEFTMEALDFNKLAKMYTETVIACPYIATPRNGTKVYQTEQENNLVGAHIIFSCDEGLTLTGPEERICQDNGEWTGEGDNDCVATGCSPLDPIENGYIDIRYENGEFIAETVCYDGYTLEGSAIRTCANGKWTGEKATCHGGLSPSKKTGIIVGVILSVVVVLAIVILVVLWMNKDSGETNLDKGTHVNEAGGGENWAMEAEVEDASAAAAEKGRQQTNT